VSMDAENLYTPGLTYIEMLTYAARLRLASIGSSSSGSTTSGSSSSSISGRPETETDVTVRVQRVMDILGTLYI
jgi:hypothetical protein